MTSQEFFGEAWHSLNTDFQGKGYSVPIGGAHLSVRLPGPEWMECLGGSFARVEEWRSDAEMQISVFAREQLKQLPDFPLSLRNQSVLGRIDPWCQEDFLALASELGMLFVCRGERKALYYYENPAHVPTWDNCAPFRIALGFLLPLLGAQLVHGAAVSVADKALLLVGSGGSGKSSTALSALRPAAVPRFLSEDYTLVTEKGRIQPLYRSFKIDSKGLARMPWLTAHQKVGEQDGKSCFNCSAVDLGEEADLGALVWPDRKGPAPFAKMSTISALKRLAPSSLFQNPSADRDDFRALVALCRNYPCYGLGLADSPSSREVEQSLMDLANNLFSREKMRA